MATNLNTSENEKFFEELAEEKTRAEEDFMKIELAKSSSGVMSKPRIEAGDDSESSFEAEGQLTLDVFQTPHDIVIESAIAGVRPEDIDINVTSDTIAIHGERKRESHAKEADYFYQECYWGKFSRSITLPEEVNAENAAVSFKNGILTVRLPKLNRKKSRKLKVRTE